MSWYLSGFQAFPTHREAFWPNNTTDRPYCWNHLTIGTQQSGHSDSTLNLNLNLTTGSSLKPTIWPFGIWPLTIWLIPETSFKPSGSTLKRFGPLLWFWTFHLNKTAYLFSVSLPSHPAFKAFVLSLPGNFLCLAFDRDYWLLVCLMMIQF